MQEAADPTVDGRGDMMRSNPRHIKGRQRPTLYILRAWCSILYVCRVGVSIAYSYTHIVYDRADAIAILLLTILETDTRQRIALGKEFSAECRALGKKWHSAKDFFAECQALSKSAALGIGCPA